AREPREARPHLLPREAVAVALALGAGPDGSQVGAGARLAEELAPYLLGGEDLRDEAPLLLLGAVPHERRPDVVDADFVDELRGLRTRRLLVVDRLLDRRRPRPSVFLRPGKPAPSGTMEPRLPVTQACRLVVLARESAKRLRTPPGGQILRKPPTKPEPKRLLLGIEGEIHAGRSPRIDTARASEGGGQGCRRFPQRGGLRRGGAGMRED